MIPASRILGEPGPKKGRKVPCIRCGVPRHHHTGENRTGLCRDCADSLTPAEREAWRKK